MLDYQLLGIKNSEFFGDGIGSGNYMDITYDNNGEIVCETGVSKLNQELQKIVMTSRNISHLNNTYGSSIHFFVGQKVVGSLIPSLLRNTVREAILYIQKQQLTYRHKLEITERLKEIIAIKVWEEEQQWHIFVECKTDAAETVMQEFLVVS